MTPTVLHKTSTYKIKRAKVDIETLARFISGIIRKLYVASQQLYIEIEPGGQFDNYIFL